MMTDNASAMLKIKLLSQSTKPLETLRVMLVYIHSDCRNRLSFTCNMLMFVYVNMDRDNSERTNDVFYLSEPGAIEEDPTITRNQRRQECNLNQIIAHPWPKELLRQDSLNVFTQLPHCDDSQCTLDFDSECEPPFHIQRPTLVFPLRI